MFKKMVGSPPPGTTPKEDGFRKAECGEFLALYREIQRSCGQLVPPRAAFQPRLAPALLRHVTIIQREAPSVVRIRLVGTAVTERNKTSGTGENYLDAVTPAFRSIVDFKIQEILAHPCGSHTVVLEKYGHLRRPTEQLSLPFLNKSGVCDILISVSLELERKPDELETVGISETGLPIFARQIDIGAGVADATIFRAEPVKAV